MRERGVGERGEMERGGGGGEENEIGRRKRDKRVLCIVVSL